MSLKALKKQFEDEAARRESGGGFTKITRDFDLLKENNNVFRMRFAQEMDEDAANVSERNGLGIVVTEHATPYNPSNPKGFRVARCTIESEGKCYGCERYAERTEESKGWRPYQKILVNAIAEVKDENGETVYVPFVWARKARSKEVGDLMNYAEDADTITDTVFKFSKTGVKKDTEYKLMPVVRAPVEAFDIDNVELFDLNQAGANIAYDKQPAFYGGVVATDSSDTESAPSSFKPAANAAADDEW